MSDRRLSERVTIYDSFEQGDAEWHAVRLGIPTASCFAQVMAVTKGEGAVRDLYMRKLAGERLTEMPREDYHNAAMERGKLVEPELRAMFEIETGIQLRQIAFGRREMAFGDVGASPDSLIVDEVAGVEFKSQAPHLLIEVLRSQKVPGEHIAQVQGNMLTFDAAYWWIAIGYPGMPMFRRRIARDNAYIARLKVGLQAFCEELDEMVEWLRKYGRDG